MRLEVLSTAAAAALTLLCFDARALTPLEECYRSAGDRTQVRPCLEQMTRQASDALAEAFFTARGEMERLDRVTGRAGVAAALEASERAYRDFRDRNCVWVSASLSAGTGASDVKLDCEIRMNRARADELRTQLARKVSQTQTEGHGLKALTGVEWRLTRIILDGAETGLEPGADTRVTIRFDGAGRAWGRGPINRFSGRYSADTDGGMHWGDAGLQVTSMAGPPEAMEREDLFFQILSQVSRYRLSGSQLILETDDQNSSLTFDR